MNSSRLVFDRSVTMTALPLVILWGGVAVSFVAALALLRITPAAAILVLTGLVVLFAALVFTRLRVTVDDTAIRARTLVGIDYFRVPLDTVATAEVVTASAWSDMRGRGWRKGLRRGNGALFRPGEAVMIIDTYGVKYVVTVDGAADAVAAIHRQIGGRSPYGSRGPRGTYGGGDYGPGYR